MASFAFEPYHLANYYGKVFPATHMYRWLSYGDASFFSHREFSFTLAGDIYLRYQSFASDKDFVSELKRRKPEKIDIGAVYNQRPKTRDTLKDFIPLKKEFVLDIDLTDYDDVRTCCQGAKVCSKCWKFIAIAVKIMNRTLREDFGFKHLLWVFSGRRGVHCWVSDESAISLDSQARSAILEYLTVVRGGENQIKKVKIANIDRVHPFLRKSLEVIDDVFEEVCRDDQNLLEKGDKNFEMLPQKLKECIGDRKDRFDAVIKHIEDNKKEKKTYRTALEELKLQLCFPRLDVNVSKELNHLLKSPFCVHPKTGKICVPFDPSKAFEFQPSEVPNVETLLEEVAIISKSSSNEPHENSDPKTLDTWKSTSLAPYMKVFDAFVAGLENEKKEKAKKDTSLKIKTENAPSRLEI